MARTNLTGTLKTALLGASRDLSDQSIFHKLSLVAFFAWVGLGADGLSSSCYGPEETFKALNGHIYLSLIVAAASVATVFLISASYSQIIELFPTGGGGYLVASKLLSPAFGVVSGSALLIDYVLTITLSIASGADALFSLLPPNSLHYKLVVEIAGVCLLTLLNLRGAKEAVLPWVPIFVVFVLTHAFAISFALLTHLPNLGQVWQSMSQDFHAAHQELGLLGMVLLVMRAYSLGAGTYTGIEAVSNGLPILREPRVQTGNDRYVGYMQSQGFSAEAIHSVGIDVVQQAAEIAPRLLDRFPHAVFFGGQLVFRDDSFITRFLHNYAVFALQRRLYQQGVPLLILPIRV